jgi:SagB-type dehydrogenase family enzyme
MNGTARPGEGPARWPRLRRGLVVAATTDGLLLEGGPSRQLLTGAAASALLPRLLRALDGTRSPARLRDELSFRPEHLDQALRLLDRCGLLEWVRPDAAAAFAARHVVTYLSRTITVTDKCLSADDLTARLARCAVLLIAPAALARPIVADLKETGIGQVSTCAAADAASRSTVLPRPGVAAVFDELADEHLLDTVVKACADSDLPVLRFGGTAAVAEVGPVFYGIETACVGCFRRAQVLQGAPDTAEPLTPDGAVAGLLASLVTAAVLDLLGGQAPKPSAARLSRVRFPGCLSEAYDVVPELECATCVGGTPPPDADSRDLLSYEWHMRKAPPALERDSTPTPAESTRLAALQQQREDFPFAPHHRLPGQPGAQPEPAGRLDESVLAGILARTAGFRGPEDPAQGGDSARWAPSGGNMASVVLYLGIEAGPFDLPGTIFRYEDIEHQVLSARADRVPLAQILAGTDLDAGRTDAVFVLVGDVGRLRQKYDTFAWRLAHLDAGCAALQLQLVAAGYGLRVVFASTWPAQLAELLELHPGREVVTAVAGVCATSRPGREGSASCL